MAILIATGACAGRFLAAPLSARFDRRPLGAAALTWLGAAVGGFVWYPLGVALARW